MRAALGTLLVACGACAHLPAGPASRALRETPDEELARTAATEFFGGELEKAYERFGAELHALPLVTLAQAWALRVEPLGPFRLCGTHTSTSVRDGVSVRMECLFDAGALQLEAVVRDHQVIRLEQVEPSAERLVQAANDVLEQLQRRQWAMVAARQTPEFAERVAAKELAFAFTAQRSDAGSLDHVVASHLASAHGLFQVDLDCAFDRKPQTVRVVFDRFMRIAGLFVLPSWEAPKGYRESELVEEPVELSSGAHGVFTAPAKGGPFPLLVLVPDGLTADADETAGPNKPLKDLAWGLAMKGVATLRYAPRPGVARARESHARLREDAQAACHAATKHVGISGVFLLGHGSGAMAVAQVASDAGVRGVVLLGVPTAPKDPWVRAQLEQAAESGDAQTVTSLKHLDSPDLRSSDTVAGEPGSYWLELRASAPGLSVPKLSVPVLVQLSTHDETTESAEQRRWLKALAGKQNAAVERSERLNHAFMPVDGPWSPERDEAPNHVANLIIEALAQWITTH